VRRIPWQLPTAVVLLALLAVLATIQYRWLGEVSQAERERMREGLRTRATEFAQEFDGELTRTYLAFQVDGDRLDADAEATLRAAYSRWQSAAAAEVVRDVYIAEGRTPESATLRRFDPVRGTVVPAAWPPELAVMRQRSPILPPPLPGLPPPMLLGDAIDATVPALVVPTPHVTRTTVDGQTAIFAQQAAGGRVVIVVFDRERLRQQFLDPLVAKYFGVGSASEYLVTIASRAEPSTVIYTSGIPAVAPGAADVSTGVFDVRMDALYRLAPGRAANPGQPAPADRLSITILRRTPPPDGRRLLGAADQGAWEVRARHRSGSLEAIVAKSHRRNIAISLGVLGLLAASLVLALGAARRQQRLAQQQMEFVAAVSHELRTPLAVICSAGENLADGVVADSAQVKRYGALIQTEGRRLGDMVERVMEFAGISSSSTLRVRSAVDMSNLIAEATDALRLEARDRAITLDVESNGALPPVTGDVDALRSAVQNIVGNALKYSPLGATVYVSARVLGDGTPRVQIRVADRGLGIDAADLPHIFKPFYRGRRAVDAQVRGAGVGLSVVRHVIDAHGGSVAVDSRVGEGTTVVVELPTIAAQAPAVAR
jgi:signal transduction histidine kinase